MLKYAISIAALLAATAANAATFTITDMEVNPGAPYATLDVSAITPGAPDAIAGLILLTTTTNSILPVFCVDLFHNFVIGLQSPNLTYVTAPILNDSSGFYSGQGHPLLVPQVSTMQSIANLGVAQYTTNDPNVADEMVAAQGAIWIAEYNQPVLSTDPAINALIESDFVYGLAHPTFPGEGLYEFGNADHFGLHQGFIMDHSISTPETSTWLMMLMGFAGLGYAATRKRAAVRI